MTSLSQNPLIQYGSQFIVMPFIIPLLVEYDSISNSRFDKDKNQ